MSQHTPSPFVPEILAPAGDTPSFLAALAAGADAVYLGLKMFSARMAADNFGITELSRMVELARSEGRKVYVAFNSLVKPGDVGAAANLLKRLARDARPHALIFQDFGLADLARQAGFEGELHFSTLANVTHPLALQSARALGADRVILPRELSIDEIRLMADSCPDGLALETFIHGALCYCVSGRCYWSSYMGGKSGLRGRCVQPCRRVYQQKSNEGRFFSCQDLSLDVLTKTLLSIPQVTSWKIEGRKKGPHYVYHVVSAYKMLRDYSADPKAKRDAEELLEMALGRPRTHARFLPQRVQTVTTPEEPTSSGLLVGKIQFAPESEAPKPVTRGVPAKNQRPGPGRAFIKPRQELLPQDYLRIGYEDENWHATLPVSHRVPKGGTCYLKLARHKTPKPGTPVFLIDRREPGLMGLLREWQKKLEAKKGATSSEVNFNPTMPAPVRARRMPDISVRPSLPQGKESRAQNMGLWLTPSAVRAVSRTIAPRICWWLPPVIWPDEEKRLAEAVREAVRNGSRRFVCNEPWQNTLFDRECELIAGPFCNAANAANIAALARMGFRAALVSPELPGEDMLALPAQSCLPLGAVLSGFWPVGIARHDLHHLRPNEPFKSPMGENFWARNYGQNLWIYPGWPLDLSSHRQELEKAGYAFFVHMGENPPANLPQTRRPSAFNWDVPLL